MKLVAPCHRNSLGNPQPIDEDWHTVRLTHTKNHHITSLNHSHLKSRSQNHDVKIINENIYYFIDRKGNVIEYAMQILRHTYNIYPQFLSAVLEDNLPEKYYDGTSVALPLLLLYPWSHLLSFKVLVPKNVQHFTISKVFNFYLKSFIGWDRQVSFWLLLCPNMSPLVSIVHMYDDRDKLTGQGMHVSVSCLASNPESFPTYEPSTWW